MIRAYLTHGNPSGDHMADKLCAREFARVHKGIIFRRLRNIRLPDFKLDITSLLGNVKVTHPSVKSLRHTTLVYVELLTNKSTV